MSQLETDAITFEYKPTAAPLTPGQRPQLAPSSSGRLLSHDRRDFRCPPRARKPPARVGHRRIGLAAGAAPAFRLRVSMPPRCIIGPSHSFIHSPVIYQRYQRAGRSTTLTPRRARGVSRGAARWGAHQHHLRYERRAALWRHYFMMLRKLRIMAITLMPPP